MDTSDEVKTWGSGAAARERLEYFPGKRDKVKPKKKKRRDGQQTPSPATSLPSPSTPPSPGTPRRAPAK